MNKEIKIKINNFIWLNIELNNKLKQLLNYINNK